MLSAIASSRAALSADARRSLRVAFVAFSLGRILYTGWAALITQVVPAPLDPDPILRPYQGIAMLSEGLSAHLLGPWQRFDTMHYLSIAAEGYQAPNSVFPPLYPLLIRALAGILESLLAIPQAMAAMIAALLVSNLALIGALTMLHRVTRIAFDEPTARRALAYLVLFPTGFFLFAGYSESLFLMLAIGAICLAMRNLPAAAGVVGFFAALTRLTGAVLALPLAVVYVQQRGFDWRRAEWKAAAIALPIAGLLIFLAWRTLAGLPPIGDVYQQYWFQTARAPGTDLWLALRTLTTGTGPRAGEMSLALDVSVTVLLFASTFYAFRHLGAPYGLYNVALLLFMLLPASDLKPLYSLSRYALMFFPSFMVLAHAGKNPWLHRLILYVSLILALYFSGQFFIWGWVA